MDAPDLEIPDAFPASCSEATFRLTPDAGPRQCAFTPADVSCNTNADCVPYTVVGCGCFDLVYGVNKTSTAQCFPPPCVPLNQDCDASGLYTQDCQFVGSRTPGAACVNHQCLSFAGTPKP